ncbi:MAG: SEC-C metal-binding domain-containing protein, partial [Coxiella endosymbiont of Haemaphysalis qinghaiensis]
QFYLSMEDNLLRIFAAERMSNMMRRLGIKEEDVIEHKWVSRAIEKAQKRVEGMNFDIRKQLLEYDDVANDQRKVIYQQRFELLQTDNIASTIEAIREETVSDMIGIFVPPQSLEEEWDISGLEKQIRKDFGLVLPITKWLEEGKALHEERLRQHIICEIINAYKEKELKVDASVMRDVEKTTMLQLLDHHWKEHLAAMDHLRQGIHLRGYVQKNPAQEYKRESFELFRQMLARIKYEVVATLSKLEVMTKEQVVEQRQRLFHQPTTELQYQRAEMIALQGTIGVAVAEAESAQPFVRSQPKIGRNEACPCGSGQKYKHCHGKLP